ncbi:hypothetical protein TNCV_1102321 [Trichonephila clavipes]|nr:hypothetical protein TNCV_1102321 [Trichonephila clavipes]
MPSLKFAARAGSGLSGPRAAPARGGEDSGKGSVEFKNKQLRTDNILVKLKTGKGILLRPVQRLYPLEVTKSMKAVNINLDIK